MKLAIMQPYFFPYIGYFELIARVDVWIVFDTVQYIRNGWINRNRIWHPNKSWQYIIVPIKKQPHSTPISEIKIAEDVGKWRQKIIGQLCHYRQRAPFYDDTMALVESAIDSEVSKIAHLNVNCLNAVCEYLGIDFTYRLFSEMDLRLEPVNHPGEWALRIATAMGATEYINAPGGAHLFDPEQFRAAGIALTIHQRKPLEYQTNRAQFIPNLSIIDVLMWNSPEKIRTHLECRVERD